MHTGKVEICKSGFHFCEELADVFGYYHKGLYCEVIGSGQRDVGDDKVAVEKLHIVSYLNGAYTSKGRLFHFKDGKLHRDDGPAKISGNGDHCYYNNGQLHRDGDLPAVIYTNGEKNYYNNGQLHRDGDLPAVIYTNGKKNYYKNGKLHFYSSY